jgi:hypothetical protein
MSFKKLIVGILFVIFFLNSEVMAANQSSGNILVTPDKKLPFSIKRLFEKGIEFTKFSKQSKYEYYKNLTNERFIELDYVIKNKLLSEIQNSSQRLSSQVGKMSDLLQTKNSELAKQKEEAGKTLLGYKQPLQTLRDYFPANSSYWMLVQHTLNTIDLNLEKLK